MLSRDASCFGRSTFTEAMFARVPMGAFAQASVTCRLAPPFRDVFPGVQTLKDGLKPSVVQALAWNGADTLLVASSLLFSSPPLHRDAGQGHANRKMGFETLLAGSYLLV